jgi:hypothetical protein
MALIVRPMIPFRQMCQQSGTHLSLRNLHQARFLQHSFLSSINRNESSDRYLKFKFTVLNFVKIYVYAVTISKLKTVKRRALGITYLAHCPTTYTSNYTYR